MPKEQTTKRAGIYTILEQASQLRGADLVKYLVEQAKNTPLRQIIKLTYDPYIVFPPFTPVSKAKATPTVEPDEDTLNRVVNILEKISTNKVSVEDAQGEYIKLVRDYPEVEALVIKITNKNLKCGIGPSTVNKAWPTLIPDFAVGYAGMDLQDVEFPCWTEPIIKGRRAIWMLTDGAARAFTLRGKPLKIEQKIDREMQRLAVFFGNNTVLDSVIAKRHGKVNGDEPKHAVHVFDMISVVGWKNQDADTTLLKRITACQALVESYNKAYPETSHFIKNADGLFTRSEEEMHFQYLDALNLGHKGLMLKNAYSKYPFDGQGWAGYSPATQYRLPIDEVDAEGIHVTLNGHTYYITAGFAQDELQWMHSNVGEAVKKKAILLGHEANVPQPLKFARFLRFTD